jgi:ribosomal-protein-alanine N-acetyltransferase
MTGTAGPAHASHDWLFITPRLALRRLVAGDSAFLVSLLNDPDFVHHIGDRGVRTTAEALVFIERSIFVSYRRHGFGPWLITDRHRGTALGLCGLFQRTYLRVPDLGYAMLPQYRGRRIASEAARGVLAYARDSLCQPLVVGLVASGNSRSSRLLGRCGMTCRAVIRPAPEEAPSLLFVPAGARASPRDLLDASVDVVYAG